MNKQEKLISLLLGLILVVWVFESNRQAVKRAKEAASHPQTVETTSLATVKPSELSAEKTETAPSSPAKAEAPLPEPTVPEEVAELTNGDVTLAVSSYGAVLKEATLKQFNSEPGPAATNNPPVTLDFSDSPALELFGVPGLPGNAAYRVVRDPSGQAVTLTAATPDGLTVVRRIELLKDYQVKVTDRVKNGGETVVRIGTNGVNVGAMRKGVSKNEMLSVDSLPAAARARVHHWGSDKATRHYLVGRSSGGFGCGRKPSAEGMPDRVTVPVRDPQTWVALKSRFFVTALSCSETNCGFVIRTARDATKAVYALNSVSARMMFPGGVLGQGETISRDYTLYIGPKKLSLLRRMGENMDEVMEFGTFIGWFCKLLLPTLNFFYLLIPNYGVAIILLTFLVRVIFWPLTHKSTVSMKKMQEIQPKLKELQKKFKDNPQKMQQETWAIYRENKVNPLSSCLPMLIQIPVFIALFTVLRSAVELRYASFLWIADLSEPENLFANVLPIPLNILPFLMAGTMALQSYLTPSMGDPQQQKMMMVLMPVMMLFMFYGFPSALSLYWTVSQALSIVQMAMIRRATAHKDGGPGGTAAPDVPMTRQQRRHASAQ